jgi:hypothetical protein
MKRMEKLLLDSKKHELELKGRKHTPIILKMK